MNNGKINVSWQSYDTANPSLAPFTGVTYTVEVTDAGNNVVATESGITGTSIEIDGLDDAATYTVEVIANFNTTTTSLVETKNVTTVSMEKANPWFGGGSNLATSLTIGSTNISDGFTFTYSDDSVAEISVNVSGYTTREEVVEKLNEALVAANADHLVKVEYDASFINPKGVTWEHAIFIYATKKGSDVTIGIPGPGSAFPSWTGGAKEGTSVDGKYDENNPEWNGWGSRL
ncbi:hypothetical protein [Sporosarcina sp. FSL K6-5500]|uniref:hypothetical protein n=1 Tax=Sporosarcina sp. FSL K6-5500 TaxID=2921558 RepID=UPI0030F9E0CD